MTPSPLTLDPIGSIQTPHRSKYSTPRQPGTARSKSVGVITLKPGHNFEQALHDLDGFEYIWVLFWFHENTTWKPKVLPPAGDRKKRGLFATRSPHRPNPIGLSLVRLVSVRGRTLRVENPDMLDGTPILDIKPYVPHAESHAHARSGWLAGQHERTRPAFRVNFASAVARALRSLPPSERTGLRLQLRQTLSHDPYPHPYHRIKPRMDGTWVIAVQRWRFSYVIAGTSINVTEAWNTDGRNTLPDSSS